MMILVGLGKEAVCSWPSVSKGSTFKDSTNHRLKIFRKNFQKVPKAQNLNFSLQFEVVPGNCLDGTCLVLNIRSLEIV